jgi:hypothetical protein
MYNRFAIETEAEFRTQEWQRAASADARAALARPEMVKPRWFPKVSLSSLKLKRLAGPRVSFTSPMASRPNTACITSPGD